MNWNENVISYSFVHPVFKGQIQGFLLGRGSVTSTKPEVPFGWGPEPM